MKELQRSYTRPRRLFQTPREAPLLLYFHYLDYYSKAKLSQKAWRSLESMEMNGALLHRAPHPIFIV